MPVYVVAFPTFSEDDRKVVDGIRARFDPQYSKLAPHVTLVFATDRLDADALATHVEANARVAAFTCVFRRATVELDHFSGAHCVFLVASEGGREIVRLHDALYTGPLAADLRTDLPYIPHVTVARCATADEARRVVALLGDLAMSTRLDRVDILVAADGGVRSTGTVTLD
jgi:2'-5' RNA ligase